MAKKAITDVESRIKKIMADRMTETADLEERIEAAKQLVRTADSVMEAAGVKGDAEAYHKAKSGRREASDIIEMHSKRLEALNNKPLIQSSEYEKGVAQIMAALGEVSADAKKQIASHVEQIRLIAAECTAEITKGNEVLHQWQHDIFHDDACMQVANGNRVHLPNLEKRFTDFTVPQFADYILNSGYYKTITKQEE